MTEKTITIRITEEEHRKIKVEAANRGLSIKNYLLELVKMDLERKNKTAR